MIELNEDLFDDKIRKKLSKNEKKLLLIMQILMSIQLLAIKKLKMETILLKS